MWDYRGLKAEHIEGLKNSIGHLKTPLLPDRTRRDPYGDKGNYENCKKTCHSL
jgi:hypothetical protein